MEIDELWSQALSHYIAGRALRDDQDTANRALGAEELQLYTEQVNKIFPKSARSFTTSATSYETIYRSF